MNILMNLYPVQSGGGQQVASNFIRVLSQNQFGHTWYFYVGEGSELHRDIRNYFDDSYILSLPYSYKERLFNLIKVKSFLRKNDIDLIYNYASTIAVSSYPQVVRSVYSNLYYPEVNFWSSYSFFDRFKKRIIDMLRLRGSLRADGLVFENEGMRERSSELYNYPLDKTVYIAPSVTEFDRTQVSEGYDFLDDIEQFKILYLSSWHLNKNIHKLPDVAVELKRRNVSVKFVLSLNPESSEVKRYLVDKITKKGVLDYFKFIGKVEARFVHQVISSVDSVILLSKLECFSSNVMEAFTFGKPLIVSDEEWARAACRDAAIYVDRDDSDSIASEITDLVSNSECYLNQVEKGQNRLLDFNTPENKVKLQVDFLEYIYGNFRK